MHIFSFSKQTASILLLGVLAMGLIAGVLGAAQNAEALSAVTFSNVSNLSSTGQQFQQVYETGATTGQKAIILDGSVTNGTYYRTQYVNTTLSTSTTTLSGSGNTINNAAYATPVDLSKYSIVFNGSTQYAQAASNTVYDVSTQDFWLGGLFYRSVDSGLNENLVTKLTGNTGYTIFITTSDTLRANIGAGSSQTSNTLATTIQTGRWYAWAVSFSRSSNSLLMLYDYSTGTTTSLTANISSQSGTISNTQIYTVGRASSASSGFFPGMMDDMIPPQIGQTLTLTQFQTWVQSGVPPSGVTNFYDFNNGIAGLAIKDTVGSNNLTGFNTPTYSSNVASTSVSRLTTYITGRDTTTGKNGYGKINLSDLSKVTDNYQTSSYAPRAIAQSTTNLYSPLYNGTASTYGTLKLGIIGRDFTSYSEPTIYTGTSSAPAYSVYANTTSSASGGFDLLSSTNDKVAAQTFSSSASIIGYTIDGIQLKLKKNNSPTGLATIGTFDSSGNVVTTFGTLNVTSLTASGIIYTFNLAKPYKIAANDRIGIKYTGGDASNVIGVEVSSANVYDGTNSYRSSYASSWIDTTAQDLLFSLKRATAKISVIDGSPDKEYVFFETGTGNIGVVKYTGSATTISTTLSHTVGMPYSIMQLSGSIIIQTSSKTYSLNTSTDAITTIYSSSFNTVYPQSFSISPASRTYSATNEYLANSTLAVNYTPNTGASAQTGVFIQTSTAPTLTAYAPSKYYYLPTAGLAIEASTLSGTSWTAKSLGSFVQIAPTTYSEKLGVSLVQNNTIFGLNVVDIVCANGIYTMGIQKVAVGDDSDCSNWRTLDVSTNSIGRELPYTRTQNLVHNPDYTNYNIHTTLTSGSATDYFASIIYDSKNVDRSQFDNGNNAQLRMLYGQCYTLQYVKVLDGSIAQSTRVCADDVIFKESILSTELGFTFWSSVWSGFHTYNATSHSLTTIVRHNQQPYNYTASIYNATGGLLETHPYTGIAQEVDSKTFDLSAYVSQKPLEVKLFTNDGREFYSAWVEGGGGWLKDIRDAFGEYSFQGFSVIMLLPIVFAAIFTRSTAGIGGGMLVAFIGMLLFFGILDDTVITPAVMALITLIAIVGILAYRFLYQ